MILFSTPTICSQCIHFPSNALVGVREICKVGINMYRKIKANNDSCLFFKKGAKILVILSCTKRKLDHKAPACELNQGDVFKVAQKWIKLHKLDHLILSAKYGLLEPGKQIYPYDQKLKNLTQARILQERAIPILEKKLKSDYEGVILILGNVYLEVIKPLILKCKIPVFRLLSKNGIFDYKTNIRKLLKGDVSVLIHYSGPKNKIFFPTGRNFKPRDRISVP